MEVSGEDGWNVALDLADGWLTRWLFGRLQPGRRGLR